MYNDALSRTYDRLSLSLRVVNTDEEQGGIIIDTPRFGSMRFLNIGGVITGGQIMISAIYESDDESMDGKTIIPPERIYGGTYSSTVVDATTNVTRIAVCPTKKWVQAMYTSSGGANLYYTSLALFGDNEAAGAYDV